MGHLLPDSNLELELAAMAWLAGLRQHPPPELVRADGWVDLRGFDFVAAAREQHRRAGGRVEVDSVIVAPGRRWQRVDFTGANMAEVVFDKMVIEDCVFDKANLSGTRWAGSTVSRSMFRGADMRGAMLSIKWTLKPGARRSKWTECDFTDSRYSGDGMARTEFIRCKLHFRTWKGIRYYNCHFVDCSFAGRMVRVQFDSRDDRWPKVRRTLPTRRLYPITFERCDFTQADLLDVGFAGCIFDNVIWPTGSPILEVPWYGKALRHLDAGIVDPTSRGVALVRSLNVSELKVPPREHATLISSMRISDIWPEEKADAYIDTFRRLNAALGLPPVVVHNTPNQRR